MPGGAGREDYSAMPVGGSGASRGRQDREGSGYHSRQANINRARNQQARINQMQSRGEGIFARPGRKVTGQGSAQGFLSGIGKKFKDWAGNMRGGINPLTNEYYTQDEYEQNKANRIAQKRIQNIQDREAPWTEQTLTNLGNLGYQGDLSRSQIGTTPFERYPPREGTIVEDYQKGLGGTEVADEMILPMRRPDTTGINQTTNADEWFRNNPEVAQMMRQSNANRRNLPITERWANQTGMDLQEAAAINPKLTESMSWYKNPLGYKTGNFTRGLLATQDPERKKGYVKTYNTLGNPDLTIGGALKGIQGGAYDKLPSGVREKFQEHILGQIEEGGGYGDIFQENWGTGTVGPTFQGGRLDIDESELEVPELNYPKNFRTYESLFAPQSIAQGGRVGYNTGGRVGILSVF